MATIALPGISASAGSSIFASVPLGQRANMECQAGMPGNHIMARFKLFITCYHLWANYGCLFRTLLCGVPGWYAW